MLLFRVQLVCTRRKVQSYGTTYCIRDFKGLTEFSGLTSMHCDKMLDSDLCCTVSHVCCHVQLSAPTWTISHQSPLSMGFSR